MAIIKDKTGAPGEWYDVVNGTWVQPDTGTISTARHPQKVQVVDISVGKADSPKARIVIERRELGEKIVKLVTFMVTNPVHDGLDEENKTLLAHQLHHMQSYHSILTQRLVKMA